MDLAIEKTPTGALVAGEMTIYTAASLESGLLQLPLGDTGVFDLDLTRVSDFDTAGLQVLIMLKRSIERRARTLRIVACSGAVRDALELCRQADLIDDIARNTTP